MYLDNSPKTSVGCRMSATLRELLEDEARNAGKTLSAHIETLLIRRDNVDVDVNDLKKRLFHLEAENAELRQKQSNNAGEINSADSLGLESAVRSLKSQKLELLEQLRRITAERDALARFQSAATPHWLSDAAYREVIGYLEKIRQRYPKADFEQILISALAVALKNETNLLFVYTLEDYWKRFPLTLKKSTAL